MAIAEIITASGIALGTIGGGVAFIWNKVEQRFKHIEAQLLECQKRETESHERRGAQITVIELLWQELMRVAPDALVLKRAKKLLDDLKTRNTEGTD